MLGGKTREEQGVKPHPEANRQKASGQGGDRSVRPPVTSKGEPASRQPLSPAVFLDRDGVIIIDKGYVHRLLDVEYLDGIFEFCRGARALGYRLLVATNQSGIARGLFNESDFLDLSRRIIDRFEAEGVAVDAIYYCPHHPSAGLLPYRTVCECRKPKPGMLLAAASDFNLDLSSSVFVGDRFSDMQAAHGAGIGLKLLLGGDLRTAEFHDVLLCQSLTEAGDALAAFRNLQK